MAWLSGYTYRKQVNLAGQSGAGTLYQINLSIGDSAGGDFYLEGHCQDFPNDIRFTDDDGNTELDYWIEDTTADPIKVWVEVADDLGSDQSIYVYYGKLGDSTTSDGSETFIFFDDFEDGTLGKWAGDTGDWDAHADAAKTGNYGLRRHTTDSNKCVTASGISTKNIVIEAWSMDSNGNSHPTVLARADCTGGLCNNMANGIPETADDVLRISQWISGSVTKWNSAGVTIDALTWYFVRNTFYEDDVTIDLYDVNMNLLKSYSHAIDSALNVNGYLGVFSYRECYFDIFRVREYTSPEPAFSSAGSEESGGGVTLPIFMSYYLRQMGM